MLPPCAQGGFIFAYQKTWILPLACVAFLTAVAFLFWQGTWILTSIASALFALGSRRQLRWIAVICLLAGSLAFARQQVFFHQQQQGINRMSAQSAPVLAYVTSSHGKDLGKQRVMLQNAVGRFQADISTYRSFAPGDQLELVCEWNTPESDAEFRYDYYLASKGVYVLCDVRRWDRRGSVPFAQHPLLISRKWLLQSIAKLWPAPTRSLVAGLLIGNRESFSEQQLEHFSRAGITHIIALSGANIAILIAFFEWMAIRVRIPVSVRVWGVVGAIVLFVLFVGAPSSVVRAAIMGSIAYVANYLGRPTESLRLLLCCCALMVLINPLLLLYDVGFQLSFLSTAGVIWLLPLFERLVSKLPGLLAESLAMTLAACVATAPLLLYQFGSLSLVAPVSNILILPLLPYIMAAGAAGVLLLAIHAPLMGIIVSITQLACSYIFTVSRFVSGWQGIMLNWEMPFMLLMASYILLAGIMMYAARNLKTHS